MERSILMFLVISFGLLLFACNEQPSTAPEIAQNEYDENTMAKKPMPKLIGEVNCDFTGTAPYFWVGRVDFGVYGVYGMKYENLTRRDVGKVFHFTENFEIYNLESPYNIYLAGSDFGVGTNSKGIMNGVVEVANPPFEEWLGRQVHMDGAAIMGPTGPVAFEGWIRLH